MPLTPGTRIGCFLIEAPLGAGGMGEVYKAKDTRLDRTVAIKILPSANPDLKARFEREAKAIAGLQHPHICTLYDVGHEDSIDYLVSNTSRVRRWRTAWLFFSNTSRVRRWRTAWLAGR